MSTSRYLTKSRFKLALDCPTKLYYTRKSEYENQSDTDSFLEGLAQGGFQVEELARMEHPNGIAITGDDYKLPNCSKQDSGAFKARKRRHFRTCLSNRWAFHSGGYFSKERKSNTTTGSQGEVY